MAKLTDTKRTRGRPPLDAQNGTVTVGLTLPKLQYDDYAIKACRQVVSVPEIIRRELEKKSKK